MENKNELALEIAEALNDIDSLQLFITFAERYPEEYLRKVLEKVLAIPQDRIKKTRGALFTFLVKQHEQQLGNDIGD